MTQVVLLSPRTHLKDSKLLLFDNRVLLRASVTYMELTMSGLGDDAALRMILGRLRPIYPTPPYPSLRFILFFFYPSKISTQVE